MNIRLRQIERTFRKATTRCLRSIKWASVRLMRAETGGALVEMALCIPLLGAPVLIGTAETGMALYDSIEVSNAAHAGTAYGMMSSTYAASSSGMIAAAQAEAPDVSGLSVTPTTYYACS